MKNLHPLMRAPLLGFGIGLVTGGFEAVKLSATLKLSMDMGSGVVLGLTSALLNGFLGLGLGLGNLSLLYFYLYVFFYPYPWFFLFF